MRKHIIFVYLIMLVLGACNARMTGTAKGTVGIALSGGARTLHPNLAGLTYVLRFASGGTAMHADTPIKLDEIVVVDLEAGTWTITAEGLKSGTVISTGTKTLTLVPDSSQSLTIVLTPAPGDTGTFAYDIKLSAPLTANLSFYEALSNTQSGPTIRFISGANKGTINLDAGEYRFILDVSENHADLTDIVHIYKGFTSTFSYDPEVPEPDTPTLLVVDKLDLTDKFAAPLRGSVASPVSFDANGQYTGTVTWQDMTGTAFTGTFAGATVYQALVVLTVGAGYTFDGLNSNSFTYRGATSVNFNTSTQTVTVIFPATEDHHPETGSINITASYWYGDIPITGNTGNNIIRKNGAPDSVTFTAPAGYEDIMWFLGTTSLGTGTSVTINASAYAAGTLTLTFTAKKSGTNAYYSQRVPLTIEDVEQIPGFSYVSPGTFIMGDNKAASTLDEHEVRLTRGFYMADHEVTRAEWRSIMNSEPWTVYDSVYSHNKNDATPVYWVNWYHAIAYCNKRSLAEGLTPAYSVAGVTDWAALRYEDVPTDDRTYTVNATWQAATWNKSANGYRLPTEAEWEWAARGGISRGKIYSGSDNIDEVCWYYDNIPSKIRGEVGYGPQPVKGKAKNELGLYDMSGNMFEYVWDRMGPYTAEPVTDPTGPASGDKCIIRGGSWFDPKNCAIVVYRSGEFPTHRGDDRAFRVARNAKSQ